MMNFPTKKNAVFAAILGSIIIMLSYIYFADHRDSVILPAHIIPLNQGISTAYLVKIPDGFLLFDTGYEKDYTNFKKKLQSLSIDTQKIKYVVLSHHHDDHSGYLNKLTSENPAIQIIAHKNAVPLLAAGKNNTGNGGGIVNAAIYALFRIKKIITPDWTLTFPPFALRPSDILIKDDRVVLSSIIGINAEVIFTPGHSSDSISLLVDQDYLLCGDLSSNFLNWAGAKNLTLFNEDLAEVYKSWGKLLELKVKYILPTHGVPFSINRLNQNMYKYKQADVVRFF